MFIQLLDMSDTRCLIHLETICTVREHSDVTVALTFSSGGGSVYKANYDTLLKVIKKHINISITPVVADAK